MSVVANDYVKVHKLEFYCYFPNTEYFKFKFY